MSKKPDTIESTMVAIKKDQGEIVAQANTIVVTNQEEYNAAGAFLVQVKERSKRIEVKRKEYVQPLNDQVSMINADFKAAAAPYLELEKQIKDKMVVFVNEQQRLADIKLKEEQEERRAEAARVAEAEGISQRKAMAQIEKPVADVVPTAVKTEGRTVKTRKITKFDVVDASKVPDEYKVVDETLVRKAVNAGVKIAGVKVWEETIIA